MEFDNNGVLVNLDASKQTDKCLMTAATEIAEAARERGLELPMAAGATAVDGSIEKPEVLTSEVVFDKITGQLPTAYEAGQIIADVVNAGEWGKNLAANPKVETFAAEFDNWFTYEKLTYVTAAMDIDPNLRFTLVATPNVLASPRDIIAAAKAFGKDQPFETYVWDDLYDKYSAEELSGTNPDNGNSAMFSLIPSSLRPDMTGTVDWQRAKITQLKADNPDLKVPSFLEAVTYWQTLRSGGNKLADDTTFDRTYIRHLNLDAKRVGGSLRVPDSFVGDDGEPLLGSSDAEDDDGARIAVG